MATSASNPTKKTICNPDGLGSGSQSGKKDVGAGSSQKVEFARRTSNSSYISLSGAYRSSSVHIPPTPDNQPMDGKIITSGVRICQDINRDAPRHPDTPDDQCIRLTWRVWIGVPTVRLPEVIIRMNGPVEAQSIDLKAEEEYVSNCIFTGGFNTETKAHYIGKVTDFEVNHSQMAGSKSFSSCAMPACDRKLMTDEQGNNIHPCACGFNICHNCYLHALMDTENCPGCKEPPLHNSQWTTQLKRLSTKSPTTEALSSPSRL